MKRRPGHDVVWQERRIVAEQQKLKKELDSLRSHSSLKSTIDYILSQIVELKADPSPMGELRRYIFVVSALVHYRRYGGLTPLQINRLFKIGEQILVREGIQPQSSKLSFLYGDLYLALANIQSTKGNIWRSAWEQEMGLHLSKRKPTGGVGFQSLLFGINTLRLGHCQLALGQFEAAEVAGLTQPCLFRTKIEKLKALRLSHQWDLHAKLCEETLKLPAMDPFHNKEITWERTCALAQRQRDLSPIVMAVLPGKTHHENGYILEAFLWTRIAPTKSWMLRFPTLKSLARRSHSTLSRCGFLYKATKRLEESYDEQIPLHLRMKILGELVSSVGEFPTVDKELLFWATIVRWLYRHRKQRLAELVLKEYQAISLKLTDGRSNDSLLFLEELNTRPAIPVAQDPSTKRAA